MTIAVVGGGITGLTAARTLEEAGVDVVLFESSERLGGKLRTDELNGITVEGGADSFLAREPWAIDLCRSLGLEDELVAPAGYGAMIWTSAGLKPLPTGFLRGFPPSVGAALRSGVLSVPGALRASLDLLARPLSGPDISLGDFTRKRFGSEVLERLVDPVLAGTRAGIPEEISLQAAAPEIDRIAREHGSVMRGLAATRKKGALESGAPPFMSLRSGMETLIEALAGSLKQTKILKNASVDGIESSSTFVEVIANNERHRVDGLVLTVPAFVAADLLKEQAPAASTALETIRYASVAIVGCVFGPDTIELPQGSGLLVPRSNDRTISAATWYSKKWPQHAPADGRASVRCFVGRAGRPAILEQDDDGLAKAAIRDLEEAIGVTAPPIHVRTTRWERSLPQYAVGHIERIKQAEEALADHPIALAGAGYRGSGIPDCIRQGQEAARLLIERR